MNLNIKVSEVVLVWNGAYARNPEQEVLFMFF